MQTQQVCRAAYLTAARAARACATELRSTAAVFYVSEERRTSLVREAEAADQQADLWLDAAEEE